MAHKLTDEEIRAADEEIAKIRAEIATSPDNTPEKCAERKKEFDEMQRKRGEYILTQEERDAAHSTVANVMKSSNLPAEEVKAIVEWACNGIDFYRDKRNGGPNHYIVTDGPGISLADTLTPAT